MVATLLFGIVVATLAFAAGYTFGQERFRQDLAESHSNDLAVRLYGKLYYIIDFDRYIGMTALEGKEEREQERRKREAEQRDAEQTELLKQRHVQQEGNREQSRI